MVCKLFPEGSARGKLAGTNAGNAKKHLNSYHKAEHADVESRDADRPSQSAVVCKSKAEEPKFSFEPAKQKVLDAASEEYQMQEKNLASLLAMPTIPVNIVENKQFRRFAYRYDKRYKIPKSGHGGTVVIARQVKCVKRHVEQRIVDAISKVSVVVDIWLAHDSSYVGVNAHFIDSKGCLAVCFLGVRDIEGTKTAERVREVVDGVLAEYEINEDDVGFYTTDNGSNLLKAYRESIEEVRFLVPHDNAEDADNEDSDSDVEEAPARRKHVVQHLDPNVEETDVEDGLEAEHEASEQITEHEALEMEFDASFPKRISCFNHCLELLLKKAIENIASVYGAVKKLLRHCDKFRNDAVDIVNLANALKSELVKRFGCLINVNIPSIKPHYVLAAVLDPSQAFLVDVDAEYISRLIAERTGSDVGSKTHSDTEAGTVDEEASYEELMLKKAQARKAFEFADAARGAQQPLSGRGQGVPQRGSLPRLPFHTAT